MKIAPGTLSSAVADVPGGFVNGQAVIMPASESKMNVAGRSWFPTCTLKEVDGLKTVPVGAPPGIETTSGAIEIGIPWAAPG